MRLAAMCMKERVNTHFAARANPPLPLVAVILDALQTRPSRCHKSSSALGGNFSTDRFGSTEQHPGGRPPGDTWPIQNQANNQASYSNV